ncbi:PIN domain-containing protein [Jeotgalicoccus halotolerans]|uniref:PIN domain-containing protein n=1 Tax=Jeotgalicoccus halotolerans TaxID=157227 RepID=UPI003517443A
MIKKAINEFRNTLEILETINIDIDNVDITRVFEKYLEQELLFESGKRRKEFPDAFIIESIKEKMKSDSGMTMIVVSEDKGFLEVLSRSENCITFESLDKFLDYINSEIDKEYETLALKLNNTKDSFKDSIEEMLEYPDFNSITTSYENVEYDEVKITNVKVVEIDEIMLNRIT